MNYKRYKVVLEKPESLEQVEWETYIDNKKKMESWISQKNWKHWGAFEGGQEGFWFFVKENYTDFKKHFGVKE